MRSLRYIVPLAGATLCLTMAPSLGVAAGKGSPSTTSAASPAEDPLDYFISEKKWKQAADYGFHESYRNAADYTLRVRTAFALFQLGFANSALQMLRPLTREQWKALAQSKSRVAELVELSQKNVPFNILPARTEAIQSDDFANGLTDEIEFTRGRTAYEQKAVDRARAHLGAVSRGSRFYGPAAYLLGLMDVQAGNFKGAQAQFSRILDPTMLQQTSEFWQNAQGSFNKSLDAASIEVTLNGDWIETSRQVTDLAVLALARTSYAARDFDSALGYYDRIPATSPFSARAKLERVWTLLSQNRHQDAQAAALALESEKHTFESTEAYSVRALVLADNGRTEEARREIEAFAKIFRDGMAGLRQAGGENQGPDFLAADFQQDLRLTALTRFSQQVRQEIAALRSAPLADYGVFTTLAEQIEPQTVQADELASRIRLAHIEKRRNDLQRLYVQSRLVLAETFLEDRERLRRDYQNTGNDLDKQREHDRMLVDLLASAVDTVDSAAKAVDGRHWALEFRQSELLWELSTALMFMEQSGAKSLAPQDENGKRDPEAIRRRALAIVREIVDQHPENPKHAQAMFFLGFALMDTGHPDEGEQVLRRYVAKYPVHQHTTDAWRMMADNDFENNRFAQADASYREILRYPDSPTVGYALYKMGWCAYNRKQIPTALLALEQAILWARRRERSSHLLNLEREARRDIISIFSEIGDAKKAREYFDRFLGGNSAEWIQDLAKMYDDGGQYEKSAYLYRQLLTTSGDPQLRLKFQTAIVHGAFQLRQWDNVLKTSEELVENYRQLLETPAAEDTAMGQAERTLNENVLGQHFEFDKSATEEDVNRILKLDEMYLRAFAQWPNSEAPHYQQAHFLLKHGKLPLAAKSFEEHWTQFGATLKEPIREEALRNLVHALEEIELGDKAEPTLVTENARKLLLYTAAYAQFYPKTTHSRAIAYLRTTVQFKYHQIPEGIAATQALFDADVTDAFAKKAFKNLKVAYYEAKNWEATYRWARALVGRADVKGTEFAKDLGLVEGEAAFLWAEGEKDDVKSSQLFLDIAKNDKMDRLRPKAYFNAFMKQQRAGQRLEALTTGEQLEREFPNFAELPMLAGVRAALYQEAGDYEHAEPLLAKFLSHPPSDATKEAIHQAEFNHALIVENTEGVEKSLPLYRRLQSMLEKAAPLIGAVQAALQRAQVKAERQLASTHANPSPDRWLAIWKATQTYMAHPYPEKGDLAGTIRGGLGQLERTSKMVSDFARASSTAPSDAYEAGCALAFLYDAAQAGIRHMGDGQPPELGAELAKIATPLAAKADEFATSCLTRAGEALHTGTLFQQAVEKWGWLGDANKKKLAQQLAAELQPTGARVWVDPIPSTVSGGERDLLLQHLKGQGSADTWYALARQRFDRENYGLAKLTLLDLLSRDAHSPRALNLLAQIENMQSGDPFTVKAMLERAVTEGSGLAAMSLAQMHLQGFRYEAALAILGDAKARGLIADRSSLISAYDAAMAPPPPTPTPSPESTVMATPVAPAPTPIAAPVPVAVVAPTPTPTPVPNPIASNQTEEKREPAAAH